MKTTLGLALMFRFYPIAAAILFVGSQSLLACNVPVFRYALERWQADSYELLILHQNDLNGEQRRKIDQIKTASRQSGGSLNLRVQEYDLRSNSDAMLNRIWEDHSSEDGQPIGVLLYSANAREVPDRIVSIKPLEKIQAASLIDSPARKAVVDQLLSGNSAVWVFLASGRDEEDREAYQRLKEQIEWNKKNLTLPKQEVLEADEFFDRENPIELRLDFSIVTVGRDDPNERFFVEMLLGSESDLEELDQPMAFPVIGRGRVLYALVGQGIYKDTIEMACKFVVGPCSCQVKDQNPGFDLLLNADWDLKTNSKARKLPAAEKTKAPILIEIPSGR